MVEPSKSGSGPPQLYSQASPHDTLSAPSSATLQSPLTPATGMSNNSTSSRPSSGPGALQSQHVPLPPGSGPSSTGYVQSYHPSMASTGVILPGYPEIGHPHASLTGAANILSNSQVAAAGLQGQKRAYRQRRKDPSCDACRERKVKCDATDSSSCSECTSRNVKCQFTKETNRRMSNIRHNQDLQKELAQAKAQVNHLRTMIENDSGKNTSPVERPSAAHLPSPPEPSNHNMSHLPAPSAEHPQYAAQPFPLYEHRPPKRRRTDTTHDLTRIGSNMKRHGRGIFKPPYPHQRTSSPGSFSSSLPGLPPKHVAETLISQYKFTLHPILPLIHWPSFQEQYEAVYKHGSLHNVPRIWGAFLFAVFACGTLHHSWRDGKQYLEISRSLIDMWTEDLTLDHARTALLSSIFLVEMNIKSAGWTWIGFAVRISFDIGLHCEAGTWSAIEEEMRRRVWWCIYSCDCLLSLEFGRPAMIKEEDCNVRLPSPVNDQYMHGDSKWTSPSPEQSTSPLLPLIQIIGGVAKLLRILKSPRLSKPVLQAYDSHFCKCMASFPAEREERQNAYINPVELPPMIYLQNARLMLYRHNLKPTCESDVRSAAMEKCFSVAIDTARLLSRCMQDIQEPPAKRSQLPEETGSWEKRMMSVTSAFFCAHIWRCTLFLCFNYDFESALWCAQASAELGDSRPINVACGCYLEFFLKELDRKWSQEVQLDLDEEMIAYVSGDLQGSFENSWIWQESKSDVHLSKPLQVSDYWKGEETGQISFEASHKQDAEWGGWDNVVSILERLLHKKRQEQQRRAIQEASLRPPMVLPPLAPSPNSGIPPNRMSIKDLI